LVPLKGQPNLRFLEVGCFEGRAACWLLDNILTDPSSTLTCIDTFEPFQLARYINAWPNRPDLESPGILHFEEQFDENIRRTGRASQVRKMKGSSQELLRTLPLASYDFIYIDGSHRPADVLRDGVLAWDLLKEDGFLFFDDYLLYSFTAPYDSPRMAIDAILSIFSGGYETLHIGWQAMLRKIPKPTPSTEVFSRPFQVSAERSRIGKSIFWRFLQRRVWSIPSKIFK